MPQGKVASIQRLGRWLPELEGPGLHFAYPSFVDRVFTFEPLRRKELLLKSFAQPEMSSGTTDTALITGDGQLIHSEWSMVYRVESPLKMLKSFGTPDDPEELAQRIEKQLQQLFIGAIISQTGNRSIDNILSQQHHYRSAVDTSCREKLAKVDNGIVIEELKLNSVSVPSNTQEAFQQVQRQMLLKDQMRQEAINFAEQQKSLLQANTSQRLGQAKVQAQQIKSHMQAEANSLKALVAQSSEGQQAWLDFKWQRTLQEGLSQNTEQTYVLQPGGELRLELAKDPKVEKLRREAQKNNSSRSQP